MHKIIYIIGLIICVGFIIEEIISEGAEGKKPKYGIGSYGNVLKEISFKSYFINNEIYKKRPALNPITSKSG